MNELQKDKLSQLAEDLVMLQTLQAVFDEKTEEAKPKVSATDNDLVIGQKYRAYDKAKEILKEIMERIISSKNFKENNNAFNKAK